jgi:hypothetical protein
MAFSSKVRRFSVTTGTLPETNITGVEWPDGWCVYRYYILGNNTYTTDMVGAIADITRKYSGNAGYTLTYVDPSAPDAVSVAPTSGTASGGTTVVITGTGLNSSSVTVTIGGNAATVVRSNATTISCVTPAHAAGAVNIVVTTAEGTDTLVGAYTYT